MATSTRSSEGTALPVGRHIAVTWDIPDKFGGLTKAMLQRSCLFAQHAGVPVEVLTLALQPNLQEIRADLVRRTLLVDGVTLVNMWEELLTYSDESLAGARFDTGITVELEVPSVEPEILHTNGRPIARIYRPDAAHSLVEVLRPDGSLLARQAWTEFGRRTPLTTVGDWAVHTELHAADGRFLGGWPGSWGLWDFWIGQRFLNDHTFAVVDSAYVGDYFAHAHHPRCTSMFVFHNNHLPPGRLPPFGPLGRWRRHAAEFIDNFDGVVFLTHQQRDDFESLRGTLDNVHVIPNAKAPATKQRGSKRDESRGIVMANLEPRKRLDHAVRAIAEAAKASPEVSLHVFGEGPRRPNLEAQISALGAPAVLEGYTSSPEREFAHASYMVLSSTNEGLPLVLAEAMAHGCIPIAYDIPYGPADVITHGVDGFLVPAADVRGLGAAISEFVNLGRFRTGRMRKAAQHRAGDFNALPVIARWNSAFLSAAEQPNRRSTPDAGSLAEAERLAMIHRLWEPAAHAELVGADWTGPTTVLLTLCCWLSGGPHDRPRGQSEVEVCILDRSTGEARSIPVAGSTGGRVNDAEGASYVTAELDVASMITTPNHVFMVRVRDRELDATNTVMLRRTITPWLPMPASRADRPILEFVDNHGLNLVTAAPKVVADIVAGPDDGSIRVSPSTLIGGTITSIEAVGLDSSVTVEASAAADCFVVNLPAVGRWKLQAILDGKRRDVAWKGKSVDLPATDRAASAARLTLTPRGYVRIERGPSSPELVGISPDCHQLQIVAPADSGTPVLIGEGDSEYGTAEMAAPEVWTLHCSGLAAGTYRLRWKGSRLTDIRIIEDVQTQLPLTSGTIRVERHATRNLCRIRVS